MKRVIAKTMLSLAAAAGLFATPTTAQAGHPFDRDGRYERRDDYRDPRRDDRCETTRVWVPPVYEERCNRVWVEPVYRNEVVPIPVAGYYQTVSRRVWVEPVYAWREVVKYDHCGRRYCTRERVLVCAGHFEDRPCQEWVPPHVRHETRQVLVCAGRWEERRERVCVREGRWEEVRRDHSRENFTFNIGLGGIFR